MSPDHSQDDETTAHWRRIWTEASPDRTSWHQSDPEVSLRMLDAAGIDQRRPVIDVGGGASVLVDRLLDLGFRDVSVLDIAPEALEYARARLGQRAGDVTWIVADVTGWAPERQYAFWHDRAVFHFLTGVDAQRAYGDSLRSGLATDGQAVIATFALDGPEKCSGLPVQRHDASTLVAALGGGFDVLEAYIEDHVTPAGAKQRFAWCRLSKTSTGNPL